jgi:HK97 family phage major capsid protein
VLNIHEANRQRAGLREKLVALAGPNFDKVLNEVQQTEFDALSSQLKEVNGRLDRHARNLPQLDDDPKLTPPVLFAPSNGGSEPVGKTLRTALQNATSEQREEVEMLAGYLRGQVMSTANLTPGSDGGVLIPRFVQAVLERNYSAFAPVANVARLFPTDTGADQVFPVLSDSESAEQVSSAATTGADATVSGDTPPTELTGPTLKAYKISSKPVFVPRETFTDSAISIIEEIVGALLARIIRFENLRYTLGTGSAQAEGFLYAATPFGEAGDHVTLDAALDLAYSVPALYRPNGTYMMSDTTAKYLRKLKTGISGDQRQLWADADATKGTPASLHGYPVAINNDMQDVNPDGSYGGRTVLAFGDFSKFVIRQAENNAPFAYRYQVPAKDGVGVILFRRSDSKLLVSEAISKLTVGGS